MTARVCDRAKLGDHFTCVAWRFVLFLGAAMPGGYTKHDNLVAIVELHKAKKTPKEISAQTGVNIVTVRRLLHWYKAEGSEVPT